MNQRSPGHIIGGAEGEAYLVGWLVEHKNGQFRVLDVVAEGVSMALTLRSEYASVIKRSGGRVEGLVAQLHEHIEAERLLWVSNGPSATPP